MADARLAYDVWVTVIGDDDLYRAVLAGTHRELARDFSAAQLAILDELHAAPGTRWNIENLRFRSALEVGATLSSYLPRTIKLLTKGEDQWLQDIAYEYISYYRWTEQGHHRLGECERFGTYARERIMKRRLVPPHFEAIMDYELSLVRLLKRTASVTTWPQPVDVDDVELGGWHVRRGPAVELVRLPVDVRAWIESNDPWSGEVIERPLVLVAYVRSLQETHRIKILGEGPQVVLEQLDGSRSLDAVALELDDEFGIERGQLFAMVRDWLAEGILTR